MFCNPSCSSSPRTKNVAPAILLASPLGDVTRNSQKQQDVVFRGVLIWIESTNREESFASVEFLGIGSKTLLDGRQWEVLAIDFLSIQAKTCRPSASVQCLPPLIKSQTFEMIQCGIDLSLFIVRQIVDVGVLVRELLAVPHQGRVQGSWPFLDDGVMLCCHSEKWFRFFCVVRFLVWLLERRLFHGNYGRLYRCSQKRGARGRD